MKTCSKCNESKPLDNFGKCSKAKSGLKSSCKLCIKAYRDSNKDYIKSWKAKYRAENKEKISLQKKDYYIRNSDKVKSDVKEYRNNNKDKVRATKSRYRKANRGQHNSYKAKYKAKRLNATLSGHDKELKDIYKNCPEGHEVDHIVPLQNKVVCGLHVPWNLQYLTVEDNRRKSNKLTA